MENIDITEKPNIALALQTTQRFEQYNYLRLWGFFLLIDGIIKLLMRTVIQFSNIDTGNFPLNLATGIKLVFNSLHLVIFLILIKKIYQKKQTSLDQGQLRLSTKKGLIMLTTGLFIGIKILPPIFEILKRIFVGTPFLSERFSVFFDVVSTFILLLISYKIMQKIIPLYSFKELRIIGFLLIGWMVILLVLLLIFRIDLLLGWNPFTQYSSSPEGIEMKKSIWISWIRLLIYSGCEIGAGIIAYRNATQLLD